MFELIRKTNTFRNERDLREYIDDCYSIGALPLHHACVGVVQSTDDFESFVGAGGRYFLKPMAPSK